jgi:phage terminase large subunit-like protein
MGKPLTKPDHSEEAYTYALSISRGKLPACKWVKLACRRHLSDLRRFKNGKGEYWFDTRKANKVCNFMENLPHIKGEWAKQGSNLKLEPWQKFILCSVFGWVRFDGRRRFKIAYIEIARKQGKALSLETLIPTPNGFEKLKNIHISDIIFDEQGNQCKVIDESPTFINHDCYQITFSNGETVIADADHQWITNARVDNPGHKAKGFKHRETVLKRVRTTAELYRTQIYGKRKDRNHSINMPLPLKINPAHLPIDPYVLGCWLGDGNSDNARITSAFEQAEFFKQQIQNAGYTASIRFYPSSRTAATILIQSNEIDIFGNLCVVSKYSLENFQLKLRELNLIKNKHIPREYLRASIEQRLSLLQGLMDTDGTADQYGTFQEFTSINKLLIEGMTELLASLGIKYSIRDKRLTCNGKKLNHVAYYVKFHCFRDELPVFRLESKLKRQRLRNQTQVQPRSQTVQIISIDRVRSIPVKCISVDSESKLFRFGQTMLTTHNSTLSAGIGLYMLTEDGESGGEVYSAAVTRDQAKIVFEAAQEMARKKESFREHYGVRVNARNINVLEIASKFEAVSSEANSLDGLNTHCSLIDELHAHKTRQVFDVLETSMGARSQPLMWIITTAGSNRAGICYEQRSYLTKILQGQVEDENYFGVIYTAEEKKNWKSPKTWALANPNLNVSFYEDEMRRLCNKAQELASAQNAFLTKHLNIWVNADISAFNMEDWGKCENKNLKLEDFLGQPCWVALDLSTKIDVTSMALLFRQEDDYYGFCRHYLPKENIKNEAHSKSAHFAGWASEGYIILTSGNMIDMDFIEEDIKEMSKKFAIRAIGLDPWQSAMLSGHLTNENAPVFEIRQTVQNFSDPFKTWLALIKAKKFHFAPDPVLTWMVSNVVAHEDRKENIWPVKEQPQNKIDGAIAMIMAFNRALSDDDTSGSVYDDRGVIIL